MMQRSIFITGAAAGIGMATARHFATKGWFVGLFDVDEAGVNALAAELGGRCALSGKLDVTDPEGWQVALDVFFKRTGRLDVLLNNAGILASGPFESIPLEQHHRLVDINIKGVLNGCHQSFSFLKRTQGARVINMASASAIYGQPSLATYSSTKFAVRGLTEALDLEWEAHGIKVMDILPLFVQTAMVKDMNAPAIKRIGVSLSAENVASTIWTAANYHGRTPRVHWFVGRQSRWMYSLAGLTPDWVSRLLTRQIATHH